MKRTTIYTLVGLALLVSVSMAGGAHELTVESILAAHRAGTPNHGIVTMIEDPENTVALTASDILILRSNGVSEPVITAVWNKIPVPEAAPIPLQPDDARLLDFVRLIKSGMSESMIAEQIRQSEQAYNLSIDDLLYLKQNGAQEMTIAALMATSTGAPGSPGQGLDGRPASMVFDDLVFVRKGMFGFLYRDRPGELVMEGDTLSWNDGRGTEGSFEFQISGIKKVWFTCKPGTPENYCYQINFEIVKGDRYKFQDEGRDSGSNGAVLAIMDALRTHFPRLRFGTSTVS